MQTSKMESFATIPLFIAVKFSILNVSRGPGYAAAIFKFLKYIVASAIDIDIKVRVVYYDISNIFKKVWDSKLILKIKNKIWFSGNLS